MTSTNDKIRALFLTALMVVSVFGATVAFSGAAAANHGNPDAVLGAQLHWAGQVLNYSDSSISSGDIYEIRDEDGNTVREREAQANGHVLVPTTGLDTGTYTLNWTTGTAANAQFRVAQQNLGTDFASDSVASGNTVNLNVDSNRATFNVTVDAQGLSDSQLVGIFAGAFENADGDVEFKATGGESVSADFSGISTGDYSFDFEVVDTDASASANVTVTSAIGDDADFTSGVFSEHRGDVASITIEITGNVDPTVHIGSAADGFNASINVSDTDGDGQVTVLLNTFNTTGISSGNTAWYLDVAGDDGFSSRTHHSGSLSSPVATGSYDLSVTDADGDETDVASLAINSRSTDSISTSVAPRSEAGADAIDAATSSDEVAIEDHVVVQVEASGLYAYLENNPLNGNENGLQLRAVEQDPGQNQDPNTFIVNNSVEIDAANDTFYAVIDTDQHNIEAGDEYEVTFWVDSSAGSDLATQNALVSSDEKVSTSFSVVEREASFDSDPVVVRNTDDQTVSGTASVAAGSSVTVTVRATGDDAFLMSQSATVGDDGTWSASFDFSDVAEGVEFTATVRGAVPETSVDGLVSGPSTVSFSDQTSNGAQVTVDSVYLPAGGFVAIHEGDAGGPVVGSSSYLSAGTHEDVTVTLSEPYSEAQSVTLVAMPHKDTNNNKVYEFGDAAPDVDADGPYLTDEGAPVTSSASVTIERATPSPRTVTVIQPSPTPREVTVTKTVEVTRTVTVTQSPGQPGFGIAVAVVALLAAALLAVRRRD